jgi:hypothetical protein
MAAWDKEIAKDRAALAETMGRKPKKEDQDVFDLAVHYKSTTKEIKAATSGNADAVAAANKDIAAWNARYASTFAFDNDVGGAVNNAGPSQEAVHALAVLKKHEVLQGAITSAATRAHLGATRTSASEQRAGTVQACWTSAAAGLKEAHRQAAGYGESRPCRTTTPRRCSSKLPRRGRVTFAPHVIESRPRPRHHHRRGVSLTATQTCPTHAAADAPPPRHPLGRHRTRRSHACGLTDRAAQRNPDSGRRHPSLRARAVAFHLGGDRGGLSLASTPRGRQGPPNSGSLDGLGAEGRAL